MSGFNHCKPGGAIMRPWGMREIDPERLKKCRSRRRETVAAAFQLSLSLHALTGAATVFLEPL